MSTWLGHVIEIASLGLFGWVWWDLRRRGAGEHVELIVAVVYGWLLETLDMMIFGTYHYGRATWLWVGSVPVYIPLLWATIMHSSMALSDRSGVPRWARPFLDGLYAVLIDLAIDAIAIRVGLWSWRIPLTEGWFGVPAGNLCAWMWVAAWYGGATRLIRDRVARGGPGWHRWLVPPAAYAGLLGSILTVGFTGQALGLIHQNHRLWLFAAHVVVFTAVVIIARRRSAGAPPGPIPPSLTLNRWLMHGSFAVILLMSGVWREAPALIGVSAASLVVEYAAQRRCVGRS